MVGVADFKTADARVTHTDFVRWLLLATGVPTYYGRYEVIVAGGRIVNAHETWTKKPEDMPG